MTTLRQAILLTADHIEQYPQLYDFFETKVPDCGTPGCLIGWISYFLGLTPGRSINTSSCQINIGSDQFYDRLSEIFNNYNWQDNAPLAATILRKYADLYHPEEVETYPEISRELARIAAKSKLFA